MATSMPRGKQNRKQKDFQKHVKQNGENGQNIIAYCWVRYSVTVHTQQGGTRNTETRIKLKYTVFNSNEAGKDKAGQGRHTGTPGVMTRPDENKLNRQELKYT